MKMNILKKQSYKTISEENIHIGEKFVIEDYDEVWQLKSVGYLPDGRQYLNFDVLQGEIAGSEITHYGTESFFELIDEMRESKLPKLK